MADNTNAKAKQTASAPAPGSSPASAEGRRTREAIKTYDLSDLLIPSLNGEGFPAGRRSITLGLLKQRQHVGAYPVVTLLEALGFTNADAVVGQVKVNEFGQCSRLYGLEIVRSKRSLPTEEIWFKVGDSHVLLQQKSDKLVSDKAAGGISFETKTKQGTTEKYMVARATLTTKGGKPANFVIPLSLIEMRDDDGNSMDTAALLQADFNSGDYSTLMELLAPPKPPTIMMHELELGSYSVLAVAEPVLKKGTRKDGAPYALNSYALTIRGVDGEEVTTYSDGDVMRQLDSLRQGLIQQDIPYDPTDLLDLNNTPHWLVIRSVTLKNAEAVEAGSEEPKYKVVATLTTKAPLKFNQDS